jgi:serine/threonine protein kinase
MASFAKKKSGGGSYRKKMSLSTFGPSSEDADFLAAEIVHKQVNNSDDAFEVGAAVVSLYEESQSGSIPSRRRGSSIQEVFDEADKEGPLDLESDMVYLSHLGKGAEGQVKLGLYIPSLRLVAIKEVNVSDEKHRKMYLNELHAVHENLKPINLHEDVEAMRKRIMPVHKSHSVLLRHGRGATTNAEAPSTDAQRKTLGKRNSISKSSTAGRNLRALLALHRRPSKHLLNFYGGFSTGTENLAGLVLEYMDGGALGHFVDNDNDRIVSNNVMKHIARSLLQGVAELHRKDVVHRDIKPDNILLGRSCQSVKLGDFGLALHVDKITHTLKEFEGTLAFMSPERLRGEGYGISSDIWSLGMSLLTIALATSPRMFLAENDDGAPLPASTPKGPRSTGEVLLGKTNFFDLLAAVSKPLDDRIFELNQDVVWPDDFKCVVLRMLEPDPMKRGSAKLLLEDPYFQGMDSAVAVQKLEADWNSLFHEKADNKDTLLPQILEQIRLHQGEGKHEFTQHAVNDLAQSLGLQCPIVTKAFVDNGMPVV